MRTVTVWMEGGVIHDVKLPDGIRLELRDYDVESGIESDDPRLRTDASGEQYVSIEFEPANPVDPLLAAAREAQSLIERF